MKRSITSIIEGLATLPSINSKQARTIREVGLPMSEEASAYTVEGSKFLTNYESASTRGDDDERAAADTKA